MADLSPPRRPLLRFALVPLVLCATFLGAAPEAAAEVNRYIVDAGPLRIRDQFLLGMGFLAFDPVSADVQPNGGWQLDVITTVTNTFAHSDLVERELEARTQRERLRLGDLRAIGSGTGLSGHLPSGRRALPNRRGRPLGSWEKLGECRPRSCPQ